MEKAELNVYVAPLNLLYITDESNNIKAIYTLDTSMSSMYTSRVDSKAFRVYINIMNGRRNKASCPVIFATTV